MTLTPRLVNRLRLKHWSLLSALGEAATLNKAAEQIAVTQPSATKMLADIEEAFGFPLFERHARGMSATPLGAEVVAYARRTQAGLALFLEHLDSKRRGGHGRLVFGAIMGAAPGLVAHAVAEIKRARPQLEISIHGETSDQMATLLERHQIDLAVGRFVDPRQHNRFLFRPLADEPMRAVVRRGHPLARRRRPEWGELVAWPWVMQPASSPARMLLEEEFAAANAPSPSDIIECTSIFATLQLVQTSDAITALPESVVRDHVRARLLVPLALAVGRSLKPFGLLTRRDEALSEVAAAFVACLERQARAARVGAEPQEHSNLESPPPNN